MKQENNQIIRLIAYGGLAFTLIYEVINFPAFEKKQIWLVLTLLVGIIGIIFFLKIFQNESKKTFKNLDLFVPLAFVIFTSKIFYLITNSAYPLQISYYNIINNISSLSYYQWVTVLYYLTVKTLLAGWTSFIVLQVAKNKSTDLYSSLINSVKYFGQILMLILVGENIPFFLTGFIMGFANSITVIMFLYLVICILWNILTIALLPNFIINRDNFLFSLVQGIKLGFTGIFKWLPLVCILFLLFGIIMFPLNNGELDMFPVKVNYLWIGGYSVSFFWYYETLDFLKLNEVPLLSSITIILFFLPVLIVKLKITNEILCENLEEDLQISEFQNNPQN